MMKTIRFIQLIIFLNVFSVTAYSQLKCKDQLIDYTSSLDIDSLQVDLNLILSIKAYEDIPFYEEIRFTSSPNDPQYFLLKKVNPDASLGYKVFDWDNTEIETKKINQKSEGEMLFTLKKHQSGNYKLVLYSKNPDGSCISISKLKRKNKKIQMPSLEVDKNANLKALTLLKEYNVAVETEDLPVMKEYSYVFTKGTDYYFYWEKNKNLKLEITNHKREGQTLNPLEGGSQILKFSCEITGIYYIIIYSKDAVRQDATLKLLYDEQSRKSN